MVPSIILMMGMVKNIEYAVSDSEKSSDYEFLNYQKQVQQKEIDLFQQENKALLNEVIQEISRKGLITDSYYQAILDFAIFWYFFTTLFICSFALLYYRKFKSS